VGTEQDGTFRVAAFQGSIVQGDPESSLERTCRALAWADEREAHVLCMPETYHQGYFPSREEAWENAIDLNSSEFADVCSRVSGYNATLLLGLNERRGDDLYNTVVVIERGRLLGRYSKNYVVYDYFKRGLEFPVFNRAGVTFGIIICADSSYVEPARILSMRGARVIFSPHFNRLSLAQVDHHYRRVRSHHVARAVENGCWVVRANVIWPSDGQRLGVGDSFILNELGEYVCQAGILTETMLFYAIPKDRLAPEKRFWHRSHPGIYNAMHQEYARLGLQSS